MAEQVRVVVDAMGGDNAPAEPVRAAVEAVTERQDIKVILTGKQEVIDKELAKYSGYPKNQIQVVNASQVIETAEPTGLRKTLGYLHQNLHQKHKICTRNKGFLMQLCAILHRELHQNFLRSLSVSPPIRA